MRFQVSRTVPGQLPYSGGPVEWRTVRRFWSYAAADDYLEDIIQEGNYSVVSFIGLHPWSWLTGSKYGFWHGFYLATNASHAVNGGSYTASARMT